MCPDYGTRRYIVGMFNKRRHDMVSIPINTNDNTKELIEKEIDRILTDFKTRYYTRCADKWIELYKSDYADGAIGPALKAIKDAGYYVWKIFGCVGRNCALDTVYRITEVRLKPTPGCKLI